MLTSEASLEKAIYDYLYAFNAADLERIVDAYTEDGINHPPIGPAEVKGKRKLRQYFRQTFALNAPKISDYVVEYDLSGDRAVVRESWTVTFHPEGKPSTTHPGQALWLAHRVKGKWKIRWLMGKLLD